MHSHRCGDREHCEELFKALTPRERVHDKQMFFDAGEQLQKFMVDDWPSEFRFKNVIVRNDILSVVDRTVKSFPMVLNNGSLLY